LYFDAGRAFNLLAQKDENACGKCPDWIMQESIPEPCFLQGRCRKELVTCFQDVLIILKIDRIDKIAFK
jgi:hypothetical protein